MFGLLKNTPVTGKAVTSIQHPCEHIFSFVGTNFLINYPKWSSEVVELEALTKGPVGIGSMVRQVRMIRGIAPNRFLRSQSSRRQSASVLRVSQIPTAVITCFNLTTP